MRRILQIHPSLHCNYTCAHCYSASSPWLKSSVPVERIQETIVEAVAMGYEVLSISGGEPMLYPNLQEVLQLAKTQGMSTSLVTNGSFEESLYEKLEGVLDSIAVSLDGSECTHDQIRQREGAFKKVDHFLDFITSYVPNAGIAYSLSDLSWEQLPEMLCYANSKKIQLFQVHPVESLGRAQGTNWVSLSYENLKRAYLLLQVTSFKQPFFVQTDIITKSHAIDHLLPDLESFVPGEIIDLLVMDEQGRIFPYTYGISDNWMIADMRTNLRNGWVQFERRLGQFSDWCKERIEAEKSPIVTPSGIFNQSQRPF